jgi:transitional endoplasmic reticulum ATPase
MKRRGPSRLPLRVAFSESSLDARRGVVRLHVNVLENLGAKAWDVLELRGRRTTGAIAAFSPPSAPADAIYVDDVTMGNAGVAPGDTIEVALTSPLAAASVQLLAPAGMRMTDDDRPLRFALLGKVLSTGDRVGLLPQDFTGESLPPATHLNVLGQLAATFGADWQQDLLVVAGTEPPGALVRVTMATSLLCTAATLVEEPGAAYDALAGRTADAPVVVPVASAPVRTLLTTPLAPPPFPGVRSDPAATRHAPAPATSGGPAPHPAPVQPAAAPPTADQLPGLEKQIAALREWLDLGFHHGELLAKLGARPTMGVLVTGPPGSGKRALVEAAAAAVGARLVRLWGPALARVDPADAVRQLTDALRQAEAASPAVFVIEEIHEIAPRDDPGPLTSVVLEYVTKAIARGRIGVVCTTDAPEATCPDLRLPGRLDHELTITLPHRGDRKRILEVHTRPLPLADDVDLDHVAAKTPGFVAADLKALCHEAALRAAQRVTAVTAYDVARTVTRADFEAALEVVRPSALDTQVELGGVTLDDVGDMAETKRLLTEAVIWPLTYPETFERLGVQPPHGALLYGPPGCGKTFLVKALAAEAAANFLSIKGAELLSKWVGESERGVRELFSRARSAAPSIVFFDEIDALATRRGADQNATTDRVVAQLLTELDGVEELRDVYVLAATNRPELVDPAMLRPGRLDALIYVPPPDAEARGAILRATARRMPLAPDVDLAAIGAACERYSAADLEALAREAAMTAMRENIASPTVTAAHFESARAVVRPSLRPEQVAEIEEFAARHRSA